ncbi:MAG: N-acyl-D-amino-acid deacylase family protein, partial [Fimbriimonas sp.]
MLASFACALLLGAPRPIWIDNALIVDGLGGKPYRGQIILEGDKIAQVGRQVPIPKGSERIDAQGMAVAPGFIDPHSHADGGINKDPLAVSQVTQGITTAVVGQDGFLGAPFREYMSTILAARPAINFAAMTGHNSARLRTMGDNPLRVATEAEVEKMKAIVEADMLDGALGLSTGLEYNPGFYSKTEEVIELAKVAAQHRGIYTTHVRSEDRAVFEAFEEVIRIGREAKIPVQIDHIKLGLPMVWGQSRRVLRMFDQARRSGVDLSANIYPYTFWQSTITVITNDRAWDKVETWRKAIAETGGADKILLSRYTPNPAWAGQTIAQIATAEKRPAEEIVLEIVAKTQAPGSKESESVIVTAMDTDDIRTFLRWKWMSICSDGSIGGSHPRGAGSFPRVLGRFSRESKVLSLAETIRRMTSLPSSRFGFQDRGVLRAGYRADLVIFHPAKVIDQATPASPTTLSVGITDVFVNG